MLTLETNVLSCLRIHVYLHVVNLFIIVSIMPHRLMACYLKNIVSTLNITSNMSKPTLLYS